MIADCAIPSKLAQGLIDNLLGSVSTRQIERWPLDCILHCVSCGNRGKRRPTLSNPTERALRAIGHRVEVPPPHRQDCNRLSLPVQSEGRAICCTGAQDTPIFERC